MTKQEKRKVKACERLAEMQGKGLVRSVLDDYKKENLLHYTERAYMGNRVFGALYWLNKAGGAPNEIIAKKEELESKKDVTVYAVTHEYYEFGECWDYWCITDEDVEDSAYYDEAFNEYNETMAYVFNVTNPNFSEFGTITYNIKGGGMLRAD